MKAYDIIQGDCVDVLAGMHERNWARALYFVGAIVISAAVIRMGVRDDG